MKYIYGPLKSRRLGLSLGITLTPYKICSFDCVYCQLGRTNRLTAECKEYVSIEEVFSELKSWFQDSAEAKKLNYITFSGSGEPTLNIKIGELVSRIRKITSIPVAVITNGSLLAFPSVRNNVLGVDLIIPSLNAVTQETFEKIGRPQKEMRVESVIDGLISLRKEFKGKIWLEIMLVKGINDDLGQAKKFKEIIDRICPDRVQLNIPVRCTAEPGIVGPAQEKLEKIKEIIGDKCEII